MDNNTIKGICIALFFLDTMVFGCIPYFLVSSKSCSTPRMARLRTKIISYLNCFAGGVFLGACLLHLLTEGRETLHEYFELVDEEIHFPVYECLTALGFFLIAAVEQLAHKCLKESQVTQVTPININGESRDRQVGVTSPRNKPGENGITVVEVAHAEMDHVTKAEESEGVFAVMEVKPMRAFLLLGAFSFHTVFDGLAVGLQEDDHGIWQMFGAIMIHKSLVALCLGLQLFLVYKKQPIRAFICMLIFSFISPVGVGVGMTVSSVSINEYARTLSRGILEGLSTGTFLYVAFFEILQEELCEKKGLHRLALVMLGFACTAVAKVFHEEEGDDH